MDMTSAPEDVYEDPEDEYDEDAILPHTPGPWTITYQDDPGGRDKVIAITAPDPDPKNRARGRLDVEVCDDDVDSRVARANARVIAAAPLMLEALEATQERRRLFVEFTQTGGDDGAVAYQRLVVAEHREWDLHSRALDAARPSAPADGLTAPA